MVGIVGYGAYIPKYRISVDEIARIWNKDAESIKKGLLVEEKSVPDLDEDTVTMSVEAGKNALLRAGIDPQEIGALYIGSESHPYTVKPSGTVVAEALGIGPKVSVVDTEFACRAGTTSVFICMGLVKAGYIKYGLAIGADTSQGRPGDALEFTASAGAGALIIGNKGIVAEIEGYYSYVTDTPDFWRRPGQSYPKHGARFTGKPAYFKHVLAASKGLMEQLSLTPADFEYAVFHSPNGKFPITAAKNMGFKMEQIKDSLLVKKIGNCYSGSSMVSLCHVLDKAKPGERILVTSYGSGAGSDSFSIRVSEGIADKREKAKKVAYYVNRKENVDYGTYVRLRGKLKS
jgi:hydroxymethylglutaryl-CoA synthase